jgi:hypothetical protein
MKKLHTHEKGAYGMKKLHTHEKGAYGMKKVYMLEKVCYFFRSLTSISLRNILQPPDLVNS